MLGARFLLPCKAFWLDIPGGFSAAFLLIPSAWVRSSGRRIRLASNCWLWRSLMRWLCIAWAVSALLAWLEVIGGF